jgi:predicted nuclease of predicted toxin-antitoxin system
VKFLADENIPALSIQRLRAKDIDVVTAFELFPSASDEKILKYSFENQRILITFDKDFGELVFRKKKESFGVILLRFVPVTADVISDKLLKLLTTTTLDLENHFTVVEEDKIRQIHF